MNKVLILYGSYGGGHKSVANSIKVYIEKNYADTQVEMVDCIEYVSKFINKITTGAYNQMARKATWAWKRVYFNSEKGILAKVSNGINMLMSKKLFHLIDKIKPDIIISTHPFSSQMTGRLKRKGKIKCKIATIMTDYEIHSQWLQEAESIDWYFVAHNGMKEAMEIKGINKNKIYAMGIPISERFLSTFNKKEVLEEFGLTEDKKTILFFGGGEMGLGNEKTCEVLQTLIDDYENVQIVAISGRNEIMNNAFNKIVLETKSEDRVKVLEYTNKVPELMSAVNMVISKPGGITTTESLASGLPMIIINPLPGQEEQNAEFLLKSNVGFWIKKEDNIKDTLKNIITNEDRLKEMSKRAKELVAKTSTRDICNIIMNNEM